MVKKCFDCCMKKRLQKTSQTNFRTEKLIKEKGDTLHLKQKGYGNSFNSWIDRNDIIISNELLSRTR